MPARSFAPSRRATAVLALLGALFATAAGAATVPEITLEVDARRAPQGVFHSHLVVPAAPGPLTLTYPRWIPGEHAPLGPIEQVVNLRFAAAGKTVAWRRDPIDAFAFHLEIPAGASAVEAEFDYLSPQEAFGGGYGEGPNATEHWLMIDWNTQVLVPAGAASDALTFRLTLRLPTGWRYDTALELAASGGVPAGAQAGESPIGFAPVSLTALVDSPLLAGDRFRSYPIAAGEAPVRLSVAADAVDGAVVPAARLAQLARVVDEAQALFGARHYRRYAWLVALTDADDPNGLEHPESSDNRLPPAVFTDPGVGLAELRILPHEYTHSWNGKYRRPRGLATGDYARPMVGDLLWIYEGLTRYLGDVVLATRGGVRSPAETREYLAWMASLLEDARPGRRWRSLADTAVGVHALGDAPSEGGALRRPLDYYEEAALVWLEVDLRIRQRSGGRRSLDDFCRRFAGGPSGAPAIVPYALDDVLAALSAIEPDDWRAFFDERVDQVRDHAPLGGLAAGGWKLVYGPEPNAFAAGRAEARHRIDWSYGLGLVLKEDGTITEVVADSPAARAGLVASARIVAVDGAAWSAEELRAALERAATRSEPLALLVERRGHVAEARVDFHGGARYPHLEAVAGAPDLLAAVLAPRTRPSD